MPADGAFSRFPIRRIEEHPRNALRRNDWHAAIAPVARLLELGLDLGAAIVFVGENGSGKSTLVEAIGLAHGLSPEGGSAGARHSIPASESGLWDHLQVVRNAGPSKRGCFLRAETMPGFFTSLEENPSPYREDIRLHERSYGESLLELAEDRFTGPGLWLLDEPESALSFSGCLALLGILIGLLETGKSPVILSTHSPLLASLPGATIYEVGDWGLQEGPWVDLPLVLNWQAFLSSPHQYLRHIH